MSHRILKAAVPLALAAALSLSACGDGKPATEKDPAGSAAADGTIKVGFTISTMQNPFFVSMDEGATSAAKAEGVDLTMADAADDASKQANDVLNFISEGMDVVILNPTDSDAISSSVKALNDAGIPVITVDRTANGGEVVTHIGTDNVTAGEIAAKTMFDAIGGKGKVAILEGVPGASSARDRGTGFENVLKDYPDIEIVATQTANYQRSEGMSVAQNMLQAHPDLAAILSMNDEMALGAIEAIKAAGKEGQVKTIGIDGGADAVKAVADGDIMVATIAQQSKLMGEEGVKNAIKIAKGESVPADQPVDVIVINKDNVADYQ